MKPTTYEKQNVMTTQLIKNKVIGTVVQKA